MSFLIAGSDKRWSLGPLFDKNEVAPVGEVVPGAPKGILAKILGK